VERHFTDSSRLALSVLAHRAPQHRSRLAVLALASALAAWQPDRHRLAHLLTRSRSSWEPAEGWGPRRESYQRQRAALRRLVSGCWPPAPGPPPPQDPDPLAAAWSDSIHRLRTELTDLRRAGDFHPDLRAVATRFAAGTGPTHDEQRLLVVLLRCVHLLGCADLGEPPPEQETS
ncbi:hypothetical protein E1091_01630, partial [Micromonospora fluostatini]